MSSPAARAEARRKAILSRGTDRLAKLATSARGPEASAYLDRHSDRPKNTLETFVGEAPHTTPRPPPEYASRSPSPFTGPMDPDAGVWSEEHQLRFMNALLGGQTPIPPRPSDTSPQNHPLTTLMMTHFSQFDLNSPPPGMQHPKDASKAPARLQSTSTLQKLMPLVHAVSVWTLLAYFVLWMEPQVFESLVPVVGLGDRWSRWAALTRKAATSDLGWLGVQVVPFFWAFTTSQILLHSLRIFSGFDQVEPPMLLSLILPHLPPPFPSLIITCLKYFQMADLFIDDVSLLIVGVGFVVVFASWYTF